MAAVVSLGVLEGRWKTVQMRACGGLGALAGPGDAILHLQGGVRPARAVERHPPRAARDTPGVDDVRVEAVSTRSADVALKFPGGAEPLAERLAAQGLRLQNIGGAGRCAWASTHAATLDLGSGSRQRPALGPSRGRRSAGPSRSPGPLGGRGERRVSLEPALTIPNVITLGRIMLVPVVFWLLLTEHMPAAFFAFILAGISDAVDGFLAKRFGWATELGAYLDPLADKLLIVCIFVALGVRGELPSWLVIAVVSRDILIVIAIVLSWPGASRAHPAADREQGEHGGADPARRHGAGRRRLRSRAGDHARGSYHRDRRPYGRLARCVSEGVAASHVGPRDRGNGPHHADR